jgi:hypothetical protein
MQTGAQQGEQTSGLSFIVRSGSFADFTGASKVFSEPSKPS